MKATANHYEGLATIDELSAHDPDDISHLPRTWSLSTCGGKVPRRAGQTGKPSVTSGKARYRLLYQTELEQEAEWLRRCAMDRKRCCPVNWFASVPSSPSSRRISASP